MISVNLDDLAKTFGLNKAQVDDLRQMAKQAEKAAFKDLAFVEKALSEAVKSARELRAKPMSLGIPTAKELEDAIKKAKK